MLEHLRGRIAAASQASVVRVWPEHWHAVQVFVAMHSQWRVAFEPSGGLRYWGLRYEALGPVLREFARTPHARPLPVVMRQLRYLEATALRLRHPS